MPGVKYQWILVGSLDAKNGPWDPILKAQDAMLKDIKQKYYIDTNSFYAGGMSGGARMSYTIAYRYPGHFKGNYSLWSWIWIGEYRQECRRFSLYRR
jgi:predicted peptidase